MATKKKQYVVVTTKTRRWLVLHGELVAKTENTVTIRDVRCAVYFSAATRSHMGLATTGPATGSRISTAVDGAEVSGWESIMPCTDAATAAWRKEEWA